MWLVSVALAEDLTWTCPDLDTPADAKPYDPTEDLGVEAAADDAYDAALAWFDASCEIECTTSPDAPDGCSYGDGNYQGCDCSEWACTTGAGATFDWVRTWWWESDVFGDWYWRETVDRVTVLPPRDAGMTWTSLQLVRHDTFDVTTAPYGAESSSSTVQWAGVLRADWPADGSFSTEAEDEDWGTPAFSRAWRDPDCSWSTTAYQAWDEPATRGRMAFDGRVLEIETGACRTDATIAYLGGSVWGQVDADWDWWSGTDADGDGLPAEGGADCDDANPAINACVTDMPFDGIDEDCAGDPDFDGDGDGYDGVEWGGDDCDDRDPAVHPGATENHYDGIDEDCVGGDDYDADADGYRSDDYGGDDCDDWKDTVHPGAEDIPDDGRDQDCDGEDAQSAPSGLPGEPPTLPEAVAPPECGPLLCMAAPGGPAWLGLAAAFSLLRRRSRETRLQP